LLGWTRSDCEMNRKHSYLRGLFARDTAGWNMTCNGCKITTYCGTDCQFQDWWVFDSAVVHVLVHLAPTHCLTCVVTGNCTRSVASVERWNKFTFSYLEINDWERRYRMNDRIHNSSKWFAKRKYVLKCVWDLRTCFLLHARLRKSDLSKMAANERFRIRQPPHCLTFSKHCSLYHHWHTAKVPI
jgi:hypothetical protein